MKKLFYLVIAGTLVLTACKEPCEKDNTCNVVETPTLFESSSYDVDEGVVETVTITDQGEGIGNYTMTKNKVYVLEGFVFVNDGQTLTIEAGTIIKGASGQGEKASALVVARGAKIMAEGTAELPIVFTAETDLLSRTNDGTLVAGGNLGLDVTGQWGGLIILGKAGLNSDPGETAVEGIPTTETRGIYGGSDDSDNSGVLKYVSVRHGGTNIGSGNEINGITLGGVGSGTEIDYVEVIANADDGIEFFGGTAEVKHALVANVGDDSFDYDEGFRGKGQFWVSINPGDRHGEHDGGTSPEDAEPYATPTIYNATYIGASKITFRDNAGGYYINSIFESFSNDPAIDVEDLDEAKGEDSYNRFKANKLEIKNNLFANSGSLMVTTSADKETSIADASNSVVGSIVSASNPVPATASSATSSTDAFFSPAAYKGAFDDTNWAAGWTLYYSAQ